MTDSTESVLQSDDFNSLSLEALCAFLSLEQMEVIDELRLYRSAVTWAKSQKGDQSAEMSDEEVRIILQKALFLIRLPTVDAKGFSDTCGAANVLSDREKLQIYHYILSIKPDMTDKAVVENTVAGFSADQRAYHSGEYTFERFSNIKGHWNCNSKVDAICFSSSAAGRLTGVGIYGTKDGASIPSVKLDIFDNTGKNLNSITVRDIPCTGSDTPVPIRWSTGVALRKDTEYTVSVVIESPGHVTYKGKAGTPQVTIENNTFTFTSSSRCNNSTNETHGQIPQLLFQTLIFCSNQLMDKYEAKFPTAPNHVVSNR